MSQALLSNGDPVQREPLSVVALTENVRRAWMLRQQTKYEALGKVLPSLIGESDRAVNDSADLEQRLRLGVHTYNLASALLKRVGEPHLALVATDRALHAARQLDDSLLIGAAAHRQANVLLTAGRPSEARRVGLAAAAAMDPEIRRSPRGLAMWGALLLTAALAAAQAADEAAAWEILGEAKSVGNMLGVDHADIYAVFGPTNVAIHGTQIAVEIGDGRGAVHRGRGIAVEKLPDGLVERRAQLYIDLARAHAIQQQHTDALTMLLQAERASPEEIGVSPDVSRVLRVLLMSTPGPASALRAFADRVGYTEA